MVEGGQKYSQVLCTKREDRMREKYIYERIGADEQDCTLNEKKEREDQREKRFEPLEALHPLSITLK